MKQKVLTHFVQDFYFTWQKGPQEHIHSRVSGARFEKDEWGEIHPVQNPRIYVVYPDTFHEGLWGGEGVIKAIIARPVTRHATNKRPPAKYLWPRLLEVGICVASDFYFFCMSLYIIIFLCGSVFTSIPALGRCL